MIKSGKIVLMGSIPLRATVKYLKTLFVNDLQGFFILGRARGKVFSLKVIKLERLPVFCFSLIFFSSCSKHDPIVPNYLDPHRFPLEIQDVLKTFLKEGNDRGVYCNINDIRKIILVNGGLTWKGGKAAGLYVHKSNTLYIDTANVIYKERREALIFHELGHGLLNRRHKEGGWYNGITPYSIMNEVLPDYTGQFSSHRKYYVDELFHPETPEPKWISEN